MNTPTPTPRTDAAWTASFDVPSYGAGGTARAMRDECVKLEKELRQLRADVQFVIDAANKASQGDQQCSELWMAEQLGCALDVTEPKP